MSYKSFECIGQEVIQNIRFANIKSHLNNKMCLTVVKNIKFLQNANSYECGMSKGSFFFRASIRFNNLFSKYIPAAFTHKKALS